MPVFKSGDRSSVRNNTHICLLPVASKVFEQLLYNKVLKFMSPKLSFHEFSLLPHRSPLHQLFTCLHKIIDSCSTQTHNDVVYLNIKKALDSILHDKLLNKLWSLGSVVVFGFGSNLTCVTEDMQCVYQSKSFQFSSHSVLRAPRKCFGKLAFTSLSMTFLMYSHMFFHHIC